MGGGVQVEVLEMVEIVSTTDNFAFEVNVILGFERTFPDEKGPKYG